MSKLNDWFKISDEDWIDKEKPIEAHMKNCIKIDENPNLINHISEHDGIRRSLQACQIIENFNPQNAKDFAKIVHDNNIQKGIIGWNMPMFWDNQQLVDFCHKESQVQHDGYYSGEQDGKYGSPENIRDHNKRKKEAHDWYMHSCVAHADDIDLSADVWKLSPIIKENYPSEKKMFMGTDIGQGWHKFKSDVLSELARLRS